MTVESQEETEVPSGVAPHVALKPTSATESEGPKTAIIRNVEYEICPCCGKPKRGTGKTTGGIAVFVVKDFIRDRKRVPFCEQWRKLCEAVGFETLEIARAWLVEDGGTQLATDGNHKRMVKSRKSFFRRLCESKGSPAIDYEIVLIMRKT